MASSSTSQRTPPAKRARFSAKMVQKQGLKNEKGKDSKAPVHVAIQDWGYNAMRYFPGQTTETQLWQLQILHDAHNGVGYQTGSAIDEVLSKFKDGSVKNSKAMEARYAIRYTNTNGKDEKFDRDNVGMVPWRGALYIAKADFTDALVLLGLVAQQKVESGHLTCPPPMHVVGLSDELPHGSLPEGWSYMKVSEVPSPFAAAPPRGYRHLVMQVEKAEAAPAIAPIGTGEDKEKEEIEEGQNKVHPVATEDRVWTILCYGGIYEFRREFDSLNIEGGYVDNDGEKREFVRTLSADLGEASKNMILDVLGDGVFKHAPAAVLNATGEDTDDMVAWLVEQPTIHLLK